MDSYESDSLGTLIYKALGNDVKTVSLSKYLEDSSFLESVKRSLTEKLLGKSTEDILSELTENIFSLEKFPAYIQENFFDYGLRSYGYHLAKSRSFIFKNWEDVKLVLKEVEKGSKKNGYPFNVNIELAEMLIGFTEYHFLNYLKYELDKFNKFSKSLSKNETKTSGKFKWKGTPAQLAYIINLLQEKGYIEGLTLKGERDARLILAHFDIDGYKTTPESLGKCLQSINKDEPPINPDDAAKFLKFPHRNELKK